MKKLLFTCCIFLAISCNENATRYHNNFMQHHEYGKGEPVIILSGGPGSSYLSEEEVAIKVGEKYHAILPEQRGTGRSMPANLNSNNITLDFAKRDLLFVMDSLKLSKAIIYGHSWGALLACAFAVDHPDRVKSIVLTGPGPMSMSAKYWKPIKQNRLAKLSTEQLSRYNELTSMKVLSNQESTEIEWLQKVMNVYDTTSHRLLFPKIDNGGINVKTNELMINNLKQAGFNLTEKIGQLKMPITIITGKADPLAFLTNEFHMLVPKSKVIWIEKAGHFPMYEQPAEFYSILMEALKDD